MTKSIIIAIFCLIPVLLFAQKESYERAYQTLSCMLEGKQTMDFKKAVFTIENCYHQDSLHYIDFEKKIKDISNTCRKMIAQKGLKGYKTAGNWAIFTWMTQAIPENQYKPCAYNFDDFIGQKSYSNTFVWRVLQDRKGNCMSLPLLYKILAQELKVEAKLTLGPNHAWIRHIDEKGKWSNIELTSGQFPSDGLMMTELNISTEAIKSGAYSTPLSEKESIAFLLNLLAQGYEAKFLRLDGFTLKCNDLSLRYYKSNVIAYMMKANAIVQNIKQVNGIRTFKAEQLEKEYKQLQKQLTELGVIDFDPTAYNKWIKDLQQRKE